MDSLKTKGHCCKFWNKGLILQYFTKHLTPITALERSSYGNGKSLDLKSLCVLLQTFDWLEKKSWYSSQSRVNPATQDKIEFPKIIWNKKRRRHYRTRAIIPLAITNRSWILTIHNSRILWKKLLSNWNRNKS